MLQHHYTEATTTQSKSLFKSYVIGLVLSIILTIGSFMLVVREMLSEKSLYIALAIMMLLQLLVQVVFFLRLNGRSEESRWDLIAFVFTIIVTAIILSGSLWIMYNLNYNMVSQ